MTKHTGQAALITRRLFAAGTGLAALSAGLPGSGAALAGPRLRGDVEWRLGDSLVPGYRASAGTGKPVVVVIHGIKGLDLTARSLCEQLAQFDLYAIAPNLFRRHQGLSRRLAAPAVGREVLHSVSAKELEQDLRASLAFARAEGADATDSIFLALSAGGTRFAKSRDTGFASVTTYGNPRLITALAGAEHSEKSREALIDLVRWVRASAA